MPCINKQIVFIFLLFLILETHQSDAVANGSVERVCRHDDPPSNFGFGHGCEFVLSFLCHIHCTNGRLKEQGYTGGVCRPFDVNCYCKC